MINKSAQQAAVETLRITTQRSADALVQGKTSASFHFTGMINCMIDVPFLKNKNSCFQFFDVQQEILHGSSETPVSIAFTMRILFNR